MPIKTQIWTVGGQPSQLHECILPSEQLLEDMIVSAPRLLSEEWMLIGRQESTGLGRADRSAGHRPGCISGADRTQARSYPA